MTTAAPKRDNHLAARALVGASRLGDRNACELHKITDRTLKNWRAALDIDPESAALCAQFADAATRRDWTGELNSALVQMIRELGALVVAVEDPTPEAIEAVSKPPGALSEIADVEREFAPLPAAASPRVLLVDEAGREVELQGSTPVYAGGRVERTPGGVCLDGKSQR